MQFGAIRQIHRSHRRAGDRAGRHGWLQSRRGLGQDMEAGHAGNVRDDGRLSIRIQMEKVPGRLARFRSVRTADDEKGTARRGRRDRQRV